MKKFLLVAMAWVVIIVPARAQQVPATANLTAQDSGACSTANACLTINIPVGYASSVIQLSGTFSATVQFEGSTTQTPSTFTAITGTPISGGGTVTSATSGGAWRFNVASLNQIRARVSSYSSGTVAAAITASIASAQSGGSLSNILATNNTFTGTNQFDADVYFQSGAPWYDVKAFGAKCDGSTDDTANINNGYATLGATPGGGVLYFPHSSGPCKFTTLTIPSGMNQGWIVSVFDNGLLGTTIHANKFNAFIGRSGNFQGVSGNFDMAPQATWEQPTSGSASLVDIACADSTYFDGINIVGITTAGAMHLHDTAGCGATTITMKNSQVNNIGSGYDVVMDSSASNIISGFGFRAEYTSFPGNKPFSITNFGQMNFHHCFFGAGTITATNAGIPSMGDIVFDDILSENLNGSDFFVAAGTYMNDFTFRDVKLADTTGSVYMFKNSLTGGPAGPVHFDMSVFANIGSGLIDPASTSLNPFDLYCDGVGCPGPTKGRTTMSGGTATISFGATSLYGPWLNTPSCTATDETSISAVQVTPSTSSLILHTSGMTDVVDWQCKPNPY